MPDGQTVRDHPVFKQNYGVIRKRIILTLSDDGAYAPFLFSAGKSKRKALT